MVASLLAARAWVLLVGGLWFGAGLLLAAGVTLKLQTAWGALELGAKLVVSLIVAGQTVLGALVFRFGASSAQLRNGRTNQAVERVLRQEARVWNFAAFLTLGVLGALVAAFLLVGRRA